MKPGIKYIVTKGCDEETLVLNDHIELQQNGDLMCREAGGWINSENVDSALEGLEFVVDKEYYEKQIRLLIYELAKIQDILDKQ